VTRLANDDDEADMAGVPERPHEVLRHYLPMFQDRSPVLELGGGRSGLLGLLEERGVKGEWADREEAVALLHGDPAPGPYQGVFCGHLVEHLTPDQVRDLLAGVRRVLAPGGRFVAVTPNPASYRVLSHDFWRDPDHVRLYDLPLLERLCREAGLEVEATGSNPVDHPEPPAEYLVPEPVVHPPLDDLVERAMGKLRASLDRRDRKGRAIERDDPEWAYELAHVVKVLAGRLQETTEALRELRRANDRVMRGLYQSSEIYVVARG
jgi:SAM-dependent methyltransferase